MTTILEGARFTGYGGLPLDEHDVKFITKKAKFPHWLQLMSEGTKNDLIARLKNDQNNL